MSTPSISAETPIAFYPTDDQAYAINFTQFGIGTRTITSVASVAASPSGLTITGAAVIGSVTIGQYGQDVAASKSIQFDMSGGTGDTNYTITATVVLSDGSQMTGVVQAQCRAS